MGRPRKRYVYVVKFANFVNNTEERVIFAGSRKAANEYMNRKSPGVPQVYKNGITNSIYDTLHMHGKSAYPGCYVIIRHPLSALEGVIGTILRGLFYLLPELTVHVPKQTKEFPEYTDVLP